MESAEEKRVVPKNWREYLTSSFESFRVYGWVFREFLTPKGRRLMRIALGFLLTLTVLQMLQPLAVRMSVDGLLKHQGMAVVIGALLLWGAEKFSRLLQWGVDHYREIAAGENIGRLDIRSTELFLEKSLGQHTQDSGSLNAASVEKGRGRVLEVEQMLIYDGIPVLAELLLAYGFLLYCSPVGWAGMAALMGIYSVFMLYMNRRVVAECTPIDAEFRKFNRYRTERWENVERVKTSGKEAEEIGHLTKWWDQVIGMDRAFWLPALRVYMYRGLTNASGTSLVYAWGMWLVWKGTWDIGMLYPFFAWVAAISRNLWRVAQIEHRLNWAMPSVQSMMKALTLDPDVKDAPDAVELPAGSSVGVELRGVAHDYVSTAKPADGGDAEDCAEEDVRPQQEGMHVLEDVSFRVEPGERVALLGPSGAGKSTVMKLLQRFYDVGSGGILVNGVDLRKVKLASWRRLVGYVPQQAQVLDGTLRYNLTYGMSAGEAAAVSDEYLTHVVDTLQLNSDGRLTDGLDTIVGRRGIKLSGGQSQRLMIAAAIVKRPRFLIIDEATSSLDSTTEKAVQAGLEALLPEGTTVLVIAHRLPTVRKFCTKFVQMRSAAAAARDGGSQVEAVAGSFEELYAKSATFRRSADDQGVVMDSLPLAVAQERGIGVLMAVASK